MVQRVRFSRKPKIFFSITQRDEQADRNITSLYALFVDQDEPLTLLTTQVENLHVVSHLHRHASGTQSTQTVSMGFFAHLLSLLVKRSEDVITEKQKCQIRC